jgi:polyisoprenoid-binding protein YceI
MKTFSSIILLNLCFLGVSAQNYQPVDQSSNVKIRIKNLGSNVTGTFSGLEGNIHFNASDPSNASFRIAIDANTVNTGINARDNHLRKEEYFNVAQYPKISFVSRRITNSGKPGEYLLTGDLTIKGTTKEISFPFTVTSKNDGLLFSGECKLNRRDFKVGGSSVVMSDNVLVSLNIFAQKK